MQLGKGAGPASVILLHFAIPSVRSCCSFVTCVRPASVTLPQPSSVTAVSC